MNADLFWAFVAEREAIRRRKEAGEPKPWTDDPVLQRYRFCNVRREHDTTTVWIRRHWREPLDGDRPRLLQAMAVARFVNWVPTLEALTVLTGFPLEATWNPVRFVQVLDDLAATGAKVYTSAYMLRSDPGSKAQSLARSLDAVWQARHELIDAQTLEDLWTRLQRFRGWGGFLAYEVVTDLRWTPWLATAPDINTFAHAGPGAVRGLNRLTERALYTKPWKGQLLGEMRRLWQARPPEWAHLELRDIEHACCELDKLYRVRLGEGTPRERYPGEG
jgi:hypothetical protein